MNQHSKTIESLRKLGFKKGSIIEGDITDVLILSDKIRFDGVYYTIKVDTFDCGISYDWVFHFKNKQGCTRTATVLLNIDDITPIKTKSIDGKHFYHDRNDPSNGYGIAIYDKKLKPIKKKK